MAGRVTKIALAGLLLVGALLTTGSTTGSADTVQPAPFEMAGKDISMTPGVVGDVIGRFTLDNTYRRGGSFGKSDPIEIIAKQDTKFFQDFDGNGTYERSDLAGTVRPNDGFDVWVSGRFDEKGGQYTFFANNVFSPPPPPGGSGLPQNPAPRLPQDMTNLRLFWVKATVRFTGTRLIPQCCASELWGFEVSPVQQTSGWHVTNIAAAHNNSLRIYVQPTTKYWGSGKIIVDRDKVVVSGNTVEVAGRYFWDGQDWRFLANQVVKVSDTPVAAGGTIGTTAGLARTNDGSFNTATQTWEGTQYEGRGINFDGNGNGASLGLTLDWSYNAGASQWEYSGTYYVQKDNGPNRLQGQISGAVSSSGNPGPLSGAMTVDQAFGPWAGWTGYGQILRGGGTYLGPASAASPPIGLQGDFWWSIGP